MTIDIDNLTNREIIELAKKLKKEAEFAEMFCGEVRFPDEDDYFTYNEVKACYLGCVGAPHYFVTLAGDVFREYGNGKVKRVNQLFVNGKWTVTTSTNCFVRRFVVHKLVARCFVPNPDGCSNVAFIDGDVNNLNANNLEWVRISYKDKPKGAPKKPIEMYDRLGNYICDYDSVSDCAMANGWNISNISCVLNGRQKRAYGHTFKFKKQV
jgi:hypothetical protein